VPPENRLKKLIDTTLSSDESGSRLKPLAGRRPSVIGDYFSGLKQPIQQLGSAFSGDPEMRGLPPTPDTPDSLAGAMGKSTMEGVLLGTPMGAVATTVPRAAAGASRLRSVVQNIVSDIGQTFSRAPGRFALVEGALGGTSGAGGYIAQERFPDSDAAKFIGEVAGGMGPPLLISGTKAVGRGIRTAADYTPITGPFLRTWDQVKRSMDSATAGARATERFQRAAPDPESVISSMGEDLLPDARAIMTPAQLSGQPGLLSLEKTLIESSDQFSEKSAEQLQKLNEIIRGSLSSRAGGSEAARQSLEETRAAYRNLLNARVEMAAAKADEQIARIIPGLPADEANRIAALQLTRALRESNDMEDHLYSLIDTKAVAPTSHTTRALREVRSEMGKTGRGDIPVFAERFFDPSNKMYLGRTTSILEMRNAQSKLREIARNSRSGTGAGVNLNRARIADNLANAITQDIALTSGANPQAIQNAVTFSREQAEVFRRGTVGRLLRTASSGDQVPEALTLVESIGLGGPRGAQAFEEIMSAAENPEMRGAIDAFLKHDFIKKTVTGGEFNPSAAQAFLKNNEDILSRFPGSRDQILKIVGADDALKMSQDLQKAGKYFDDPIVSKASLFIEKGPEKAFSDVLGSRNPVREMDKLVDMVGRDGTGEALEGLKSGFYEFLMSKSDVNGVISGRKLAEIINVPKSRQAIKSLLSEGEFERLQTLVRTAERADAARLAASSKEGILGDELSGTLEAGLGILGAAFGRHTSSALGGGTVQIPGIMANRFRSLGKAGLLNPARRLVIDALQDEKLFKEVLLAVIREPEKPLSAVAVRRFNAWAAFAAADLLDSEEEKNGK
jgi:hypothetical protein